MSMHIGKHMASPKKAGAKPHTTKNVDMRWCSMWAIVWSYFYVGLEALCGPTVMWGLTWHAMWADKLLDLLRLDRARQQKEQAAQTLKHPCLPFTSHINDYWQLRRSERM